MRSQLLTQFLPYPGGSRGFHNSSTVSGEGHGEYCVGRHAVASNIYLLNVMINCQCPNSRGILYGSESRDAWIGMPREDT